MRIAVDLDDVVIDLTPTWIREYYQLTGDLVKFEDLNQWDFSKLVKYPSNLYSLLEPHNEIYNHCAPVEGALDAIKALEREFDVVYVTAEFQPSKLKWLRRYNLVDATEKHPSNVVVASNKSLVNASMLIDDKPINVIKYPAGGYIFAKPWNETPVLPNKVQRLDGWQAIIENIGLLSYYNGED